MVYISFFQANSFHLKYMFYDGICPLFYFFLSTVGLKYTQFKIDCRMPPKLAVDSGKIRFLVKLFRSFTKNFDVFHFWPKSLNHILPRLTSATYDTVKYFKLWVRLLDVIHAIWRFLRTHRNNNSCFAFLPVFFGSISKWHQLSNYNYRKKCWQLFDKNFGIDLVYL